MKRIGKKVRIIKIFFFLVVMVFTSGFIGIEKEIVSIESRVKWMTFEEAVEKSKTEKRKVFIDVYTDWCGWCKEMDKNTFSHEVIAAYLNENFYAVKLNGEQKEDIIFRGTTFKFVAQGRNGYHELAAALLNGKLSYPTVVFLDENFDMLQPLPGYQKPDFFDAVLKYIGGDHYKKVKWTDFQQSYKSPF